MTEGTAKNHLAATDLPKIHEKYSVSMASLEALTSYSSADTSTTEPTSLHGQILQQSAVVDDSRSLYTKLQWVSSWPTPIGCTPSAGVTAVVTWTSTDGGCQMLKTTTSSETMNVSENENLDHVVPTHYSCYLRYHHHHPACTWTHLHRHPALPNKPIAVINCSKSKVAPYSITSVAHRIQVSWQSACR